MITWIRQLLCDHVDDVTTEPSEFYGDVVICGDAQTWETTLTRATCTKCGRTTITNSSPPRYQGWT